MPDQYGIGAAYDAALAETVVFGGLDSSYFGTYSARTFAWAGGSYALRAESGPSARTSPLMVFDAARNLTVLIGGNNQGALGDTWEWDGATWTQRQIPGISSAPVAAAYDSDRAVTTVLTHGLGAVADTWEYNGVGWTQRPNTGLPQRTYAAMAYDSARHVTVLFGGLDNSSNVLADTWEWNGAVWTQRQVFGPSGRFLHAMAYDRNRGVTVLVGGATGLGVGQVDAQTWEWNGQSWTQRSPAQGPGVRRAHALVFDSARGA